MSSKQDMNSPTNIFKPAYKPSSFSSEPSATKSLIETLSLTPHIEGGYFAETDRHPTTTPTPFPPPTSASERTLKLASTNNNSHHPRPGFDVSKRNLSTSMYFLPTPHSPTGHMCRNRGRTVHAAHPGRGRYVLVHPEEDGRVETFVAGTDVEAGERAQWVVEGGVWKGSFLLPDSKDDSHGSESTGFLISETVVPGFEYCDHEFLGVNELERLVGEEKAGELEWLCRKDGDLRN